MALPRHPAAAPSELDDDGYLPNPHHWNRALALRMAKADGLPPLTETQWDILHSIRDHYLKYGEAPAAQFIERVHHLGRRGLQQLFGGMGEALRLAGLPCPQNLPHRPRPHLRTRH